MKCELNLAKGNVSSQAYYYVMLRYVTIVYFRQRMCVIEIWLKLTLHCLECLC